MDQRNEHVIKTKQINTLSQGQVANRNADDNLIMILY